MSEFDLQIVRDGDLDTFRNIDDLSQELIEKSMNIAVEEGYFDIFKYWQER